MSVQWMAEHTAPRHAALDSCLHSHLGLTAAAAPVLNDTT